MPALRLRLSAEPGELAEFDGQARLEQAQPRLRQVRHDVLVTHVEQLAPDAVGVVLFVEELVLTGAEVDDLAAELRTALGIGAGTNELVSDDIHDPYVIRGGPGKGIIGEDSVCPSCGLPGGRHVPGCPRDV
jgi:hypothetical protein